MWGHGFLNVMLQTSGSDTSYNTKLKALAIIQHNSFLFFFKKEGIYRVFIFEKKKHQQ